MGPKPKDGGRSVPVMLRNALNEVFVSLSGNTVIEGVRKS